MFEKNQMNSIDMVNRQSLPLRFKILYFFHILNTIFVGNILFYDIRKFENLILYKLLLYPV